MTKWDVLGCYLAYTMPLFLFRSEEGVWPPVWKLPLSQWRLWQWILISVWQLHCVHLQGKAVLRGCGTTMRAFGGVTVNIKAEHDVFFIRKRHYWCHFRREIMLKTAQKFKHRTQITTHCYLPRNNKLTSGGDNSEWLSEALSKIRQMHMAMFSGSNYPQWIL